MPITLKLDNKLHMLPAVRNRIGRAPHCQLCLPGGEDSIISWEHASLDFVNGSLFVTDLGSTNGTFLNGVKLVKQ